MNTRGLAAKVNKAAFAVIRFLLMHSSHHTVLDRGPAGSKWINQREGCILKKIPLL